MQIYLHYQLFANLTNKLSRSRGQSLRLSLIWRKVVVNDGIHINFNNRSPLRIRAILKQWIWMIEINDKIIESRHFSCQNIPTALSRHAIKTEKFVSKSRSFFLIQLNALCKDCPNMQVTIELKWSRFMMSLMMKSKIRNLYAPRPPYTEIFPSWAVQATRQEVTHVPTNINAVQEKSIPKPFTIATYFRAT